MKMCEKKQKKKKALVYFLVRTGIPKFQPGAMAHITGATFVSKCGASNNPKRWRNESHIL